MRNEVKAAIAGTVGVTLLLGGAGTLAYWTDDAVNSPDDIQGGNLTLEPTIAGCTDWEYAVGSLGAGTTVTTIVPGDEVSLTCAFTVVATGDHLSARIDVKESLTATPGSTLTSFDMDVAATYELTRTDSATRSLTDASLITSADNGATIEATVTASFPYGTGEVVVAPTIEQNNNDTKSALAALDDVAITLTQADPNS